MRTQATHSYLPGARQHTGRRLSVLLMVLAMVAAVRVPAWDRSVNDTIWLETDSTTGNSILAFRDTGSGSPTFLASTPAGGIGVFDKTFAFGPFDSDQNLITNHEGTLLFAVNSGSNSIAVFHITSNGLQAVDGSPFPSGGTDPVSMGYGNRLARPGGGRSASLFFTEVPANTDLACISCLGGSRS